MLAFAAGAACRLVWAVAWAGLTAAPAAALGPAPPEDVSRLWSQYPAGEQPVHMSPGPTTPTQPDPAAPPETPAPGAVDNSGPAELTRTPAASQSPSASPERHPWLLGAGVAIALGMGLLVLLVLALVALKARPGVRKPARAAPTDDADRPTVSTPQQTVALTSPPTPPAASPQTIPAQRNGAAALSHLLLVPTPDGYSLIQSGGEAPGPGTTVDEALLPVEGEFVVARVGPSPLPLDPRRCAYLERRHA